MRHTRFQGAIVEDHRLLLIKHFSHKSNRSYWVLPGGGIEPGETEVECVAREMHEETGLRVRVERLLLDVRNDPHHFYRRQKTFLCSPLEGTAAPGVEPEDEAANFEIVDVCWIDLRRTGTWAAVMAEADWVIPLLWEIRTLLGYGDGRPDNVERLRILTPDLSKSGTTTLRRAGTQDAGRLRASADSQSAADSHSAAWSLEDELTAESLYLAEADGQLVGLIATSDVSLMVNEQPIVPNKTSTLFLRHLWLTEKGMRIAAAPLLLEHIRREASRFGYDTVRAEIDARDPMLARELTRQLEQHRYAITRKNDLHGEPLLCYEASCS